MLQQQKAEGDLLTVYARLIAIVLVFVLMAILGGRYFYAAPDLVKRNLQLEHDRMVNMLVMVRSQWLSLGKPTEMKLDWETLGQYQQQAITMYISSKGMPLPNTRDSQGCQQLWNALLGSDISIKGINVDYSNKDDACVFFASDKEQIIYSMLTGKVSYLTQI